MVKEGILSPGFRSAAAMAGWDEEALILASLIVEDTPVRESRHKKRSSPASTNSTSHRKRRSRRQPLDSIPPVVLCLDDEEKAVEKDPSINRKDPGTVVLGKEQKAQEEGDSTENAASKGLACLDRLREELSCAICLEICFEPSTTPCGHSFCIKCLKCAAAKCGKRCPKCRQLINIGRSCTVNTVLWNTIQLLFPEEVEERKNSVAASLHSSRASNQSPQQSGANTRRIATQVPQAVETSRSSRRRGGPSQSEDAALAFRLQREEFMVAFSGTREQQRNVLHSARANLRAMASRAIHIRTRGRSS